MQATQGGSYVAYMSVATAPGYTAFTAGAGSIGAMPGLLGGGMFAGANLSLGANLVNTLGGGALIGHQMMAAMGGGDGYEVQLTPDAEATHRRNLAAGDTDERSLAAYKLGSKKRIGSSHYDLARTFPEENFASG